MSENESAPNGAADTTGEVAVAEAAAVTEDISYHAVEKDGVVTAIWEMNGRKHVRTIDPRSRQGQDILRLDHPPQQDGDRQAGEQQDSIDSIVKVSRQPSVERKDHAHVAGPCALSAVPPAESGIHPEEQRKAQEREHEQRPGNLVASGAQDCVHKFGREARVARRQVAQSRF